MLLSPSFLGRVFGKERFLKVFLSLCGQQLYVGFSLWMALWEGVSLWWSGGVCSVVMGNPWTIFFIVVKHIHCGWICFRLLGFNGSCCALLQVYYFVGETGLGSINKIFGIWFQAIWCGLFDEMESFDVDCLKNRWINYNICASELFLFSLSLGIPQIVLLGFSIEGYWKIFGSIKGFVLANSFCLVLVLGFLGLFFQVSA